VECARVAFASLRAVKGPNQPGQTDFHLESGMSALVGKLLALGMHDQALKELRLLKRRFEASSNSKKTKAPQPESSSAETVAELLKFPTPIACAALPTVTTCQIQVLKLIASIKKPAYIEATLPLLKENHESSPINLLSLLATEGSKEAGKAARQMATLSQIILSLAPSVSSQEDAYAMEPRLSPSPLVAFELQSLAFQTQLKWWKLAGHTGKADDEVLSPFLRCVKTFSRRHTTDDALLYKTVKASFETTLGLINLHGHTTDASSNSPTSSIHLILGTTAYVAKQYDESSEWFGMLKASIESPEDCAVRHAYICARLLASSLKTTKELYDLEQLAQTVLDSLEGSLSGTIAELNELLESLALARRSAVGRLMDVIDPNSTTRREPTSCELLLKEFILRYPHFVRRWLGNSPGKDSSPKAHLQFDQRRQLVTKSISQTLDATLMIVKCDIQAGDGEWKRLDEVLQHCSSLVDTLTDSTISASRSEQFGGYYVKISSLYFSKFSQLRKRSNRTKEENKQLLQTLNRSIDIVKDRSPAEKDKAQLSTKLEVFADLCKSAGRTDDAVRTLRSICTGMAEDGVMKDVATSLAAEAPGVAWSMTSKARMLSRTLRQIAKLDKSWTDWTFFLPEAERAAVLEHLVHLSSSNSTKNAPLRLRDSNVSALLRIYSVDKYPVRRLRVLLHIAHQNLGDEDEVDETMALVEQALRQTQSGNIAEDEALSNFVPHLTASRGCMQAILATEASPSIPALAESISTWETILQSCNTMTDIYKKVDDPDGLLDRLQSMSQLVGLRGENSLQLTISQLLVGISRIFAGHGHTTNTALIVRQSQLASQLISFGSYAQAMVTLEQAKSQIEEIGVLPPSVTIAYNLSRAEYLAGVGSIDDA
jgi:separase